MRSARFNPIITCCLLLQLFHLPLPCPDLDGECRGIPIISLADGNAWHVLVLGVRPNDDVDRGPFRDGDSDETDFPGHFPFDEAGSCVTATSADSLVLAARYAEPNFIVWISSLDPGLSAFRPVFVDVPDKHLFNARIMRAISCVWLI